MDQIQEIIKHGGVFMILNILCMATVLAVTVERTIYFLGRSHVNIKKLLEDISDNLAKNDLQAAVHLCQLCLPAPAARVALAGLKRINKGEAAVAQSIEETMVDVTPEVKTRISSLWSLANIATLLGLLGTITGLIATFRATMKEGMLPDERTRQLSKGISEAMYNTAAGLLIAVTCMVAHLFLSAAAKKTVGDLESFSLRLENMLGEGGVAAGSHTREGR